MVELLKAYSNVGDQVERLRSLLNLPQVRRSDERSRPAKQRQHRLTADQRTELIARYQAGEKAYQLAQDYNVHRSTVSQLLADAGVRRPRSLTPDQIQEAITLYHQGWSCQRIGDHFGKDHGTIWRALKAAGVAMRDTHGRDR